MIYTSFDAIPRGRFRCLAIDPPWATAVRSPKGITRRAADHHYPTMGLDAIKALPIRSIAHKDAHVFLWTTQPHMEQAFEVLRAWQVPYSSVFKFWLKLNSGAASVLFLTEQDFFRGMGRTTRKGVEVCLLGRIGSPKRLRKDMGDVLVAARRRHSEKPDRFYSDAETYCVGPRIELFSRRSREGWSTFGNEAGKFDPPQEAS